MPASRRSTAARFAELRQELQKLEYFCKGTILERRMKCGQPACPCHSDPAKRHGPYWEWTYKAGAKTINVRLQPTAGPLYRAASQQYRRLKSLLKRLETISRAGLAALAKDAQPRPASRSSSRTRTAKPRA
jgi:type II secretory pathway component PulJ